MTALLRFLLRKMGNNRWSTLSSFLGLTLAVALTSSIPIYADSAVSRIISDALADPASSGAPGSLSMRYQAALGDYTEPEDLAALDRYIQDELPAHVGFEALTTVSSYSLAPSLFVPESQAGDGRRRQMTLMAQSGLREQIEIVDGSMYGAGESGDVVEAIVSETALSRNYLTVGETYRYTIATRTGNVTITVRIAGAFRPLDATSAYWHQGTGILGDMLFIDPALFEEELLVSRHAYLSAANWFANFDLSSLRTSDLARLEGALERLELQLFQMLRNTRIDVGFLDLIRQFRFESLKLQGILFALAAPMLGMCFYYIYMNAAQSLERQRNDIAVLRSRGASKGWIFTLFALEGALLGAVAWAVGLFGGYAMAKVIVSTDEFMRFVSGKEQAVSLTASAAGYGLAAVFAALFAVTIPVLSYARTSVVDYKRQLARADRKPIWQRLYLDIVLVLAAAFGWYMYGSEQWFTGAADGSGSGFEVQPVYFFLPALAIFALGLFSLRLFPLLLKLIHLLLRRFVPVSLHLAFLQLSRAEKSYYPLMLLLILTLGLGVYHASAARTIDLNIEQSLLYENGADVVLQTVWEGEVQLFDSEGNYIGDDEPRTIVYSEPPLIPFDELPGVRAAARVLELEGELSAAGQTYGKGTLMGIDNRSFAESASFRSDLYPVHPYVLLRWLGVYEQAAIVSRSFAERAGLQQGDIVQMTVRGQPLEWIVVGIVDYWPGQNPAASFIVGNLDYIYEQIPLTPYVMWLHMEDGAKVMPVVEQLRSFGVETASVRDVRNEWIQHKRQPSREGVFGILSLGFLVSAVISFSGYLLFWMYNISRRTLQMGVLRAAGLLKRQLTAILFVEQLLTTGLSIVLGAGIGRLVGTLFLPLLQGGWQEQWLPFTIVFENKDALQLIAVVVTMLLIGAALLAGRIRALKVHQAMKLGEER